MLIWAERCEEMNAITESLPWYNSKETLTECLNAGSVSWEIFNSATAIDNFIGIFLQSEQKQS